MGIFAAYRWAAPAVAVSLSFTRLAVAEPTAAPARTHEAAPESTVVGGRTRGEETARLLAEKQSLGRAGPVTLIVLGGAVTVFSLAGYSMRGLSGLCDSSACSNEPKSDGSGFLVVGAVGAVAAVAGIVLLVDVQDRRAEIDRRLRLLGGGDTALLPGYDPKTKAAGLTFTHRF